MADNNNHLDIERVNLNDAQKVLYWCMKFGCTPDRLVAAIRNGGVMAKDVEAELKRSASRGDAVGKRT
jgi:hypothetical protein